MSRQSQSDTVTDMDAKILKYSKLLETVPPREKPSLQTKLLSAKLMREKFVAMTAFAKAQAILAEMEVLMAENNLKCACEQLDLFQKDLEKKSDKLKSSNENKKKPERKTRDSRSPDQEKQKKNTTNLKKDKSESNKKNHKSESNTRNHRTESNVRNKNSESTTKNHKNHSDTNSNKRRNSNSSHSKSKKSKTSENSARSLKSNSLSPIKKINDKANDLELGNMRPTLNDDADTIVLEDLSQIHRDLQASNINRSELAATTNSKIQICYEDEKDVRPFRSVKKEATCDLDTTDFLVNGLFKDILAAKAKVMSTDSESHSSIVSKTMLRDILKQC